MTTVLAARSKTDRRIEQIDDERSIGNGWFVYLRPGFRYGDAHCFSEDTKRDVARTMSQVEPCDCEDCRKALASTGKLWS